MYGAETLEFSVIVLSSELYRKSVGLVREDAIVGTPWGTVPLPGARPTVDLGREPAVTRGALSVRNQRKQRIEVGGLRSAS
jgi:hypothetical protein